MSKSSPGLFFFCGNPRAVGLYGDVDGLKTGLRTIIFYFLFSLIRKNCIQIVIFACRTVLNKHIWEIMHREVRCVRCFGE